VESEGERPITRKNENIENEKRETLATPGCTRIGGGRQKVKGERGGGGVGLGYKKKAKKKKGPDCVDNRGGGVEHPCHRQVKAKEAVEKGRAQYQMDLERGGEKKAGSGAPCPSISKESY